MRPSTIRGACSRLLPTPTSTAAISSGSSRRGISSADLTTTTSKTTTTMPPKEELQFGKTFSPHMLQCRYAKSSGGWEAPRIVPFQDLKLSPAASALHYGLECFEGMKAYKTIRESDGNGNANDEDNHDNGDHDVRLFRPELNMRRLKNSMDRLAMPGSDFDPSELIGCIAELARLDRDWIPSGEGYSLYLRPTVIATHPYLGVAPPEELLLYVIASPVGPYYASGFDPVRLTADTPYVRAWPGGSGNAKVGGNYAPTMKPGADAMARGYSQILWLFGEDEEVTEVGAMNVFFLLEVETGGEGGTPTRRRRELVTPPLDRGDILPGVTRQSILELCREHGDFDVVERWITMPEIEAAAKEGRLIEAFGAGTAAVVTPISHIQYRGADIEIPAPGKLTERMFSDLTGIQYGRVEGPEGWSVKI